MDFLNHKAITTIYTALLFILVLTAGTAMSYASGKTSQKQKVIAGAIYKFIKFVDWEDNVVNSQATFNLCLLQNDAAFEPFKKRKIQGKTIQIIVFNHTHQPDNCNVLYLNSTENNHQQILDDFKNNAVLTISEQAGFITQGGMIELGSANNRLTFGINLFSAKQQRLNIGFQLLSLARTVIEN